MLGVKKFFAISFIFLVFIISYVPSAKSDSQLERLVRTTSAKFLGRPYILDALGEGQGAIKDSDPLYRTDAFDCLTFVETVLAHTISQEGASRAEIENTLSTIRYRDGAVSFENRHHFQYPDWTTGNQKLLTDTTIDLAKSINAKTATSTINLCRKNWFKKSHNVELSSSYKNTAECEDVTITYIPFSELEQHIQKLETIQTTPLVFMTVINDPTLPEKIGTEYNISHTGFIIPSSGKIYIRHASVIAKKVVDSNFLSYIQKLQKNKKYLGFAFLKLNNI